MNTKTVSSTQAQNNFGQVLDDVTRTRTRYVVNRRGNPIAVVLSFDDFIQLLSSEPERREMASLLAEIRPVYNIGTPVHLSEEEAS